MMPSSATEEKCKLFDLGEPARKRCRVKQLRDASLEDSIFASYP
jgi:hypothetical protein